MIVRWLKGTTGDKVRVKGDSKDLELQKMKKVRFIRNLDNFSYRTWSYLWMGVGVMSTDEGSTERSRAEHL